MHGALWLQLLLCYTAHIPVPTCSPLRVACLARRFLGRLIAFIFCLCPAQTCYPSLIPHLSWWGNQLQIRRSAWHSCWWCGTNGVRSSHTEACKGVGEGRGWGEGVRASWRGGTWPSGHRGAPASRRSQVRIPWWQWIIFPFWFAVDCELMRGSSTWALIDQS
jgi:hypothetical protein